MDGETRSLDAGKREALTNNICDTIREAAAKFGAGVEIVTETLYHDYYLGLKDDLPVKLACEAAEKLGLTPKLEKTGGGSDANIFNKMGIATAVLGIGMSKVHTTEEYITIDDLCGNAAYLLRS